MGISEILLSAAFLLSQGLNPDMTDFSKGKMIYLLFFLMRANWMWIGSSKAW